MNLYIIFGQRKERYAGQYAPEALGIIDEDGYDENPDWLANEIAKYRADSSFLAVKVVTIQLKTGSQEAIRAFLTASPKLILSADLSEEQLES